MTTTKELKVAIVGITRASGLGLRLVEELSKNHITQAIEFDGFVVPDFMLYHLVDTYSDQMLRILDTHMSDKCSPPPPVEKYDVTKSRCIQYANEIWYNRYCNHL